MTTEEIILSTSATVYNNQNYITSRGTTVAIVDEEYIRIGSCLYWRKDLIEYETHLECLASGAIIKF